MNHFAAISEKLSIPAPVILGLVISILAVIIILLVIRRWSKEKKTDQGVNYLKGLTYLTSGQTDKAIDEFVRLAQIDPDSLEAYLSLGNLYRRRGDLDRAIRLHRGLLARPTLDRQLRMQVLMALGEDYQKAGLWGRAKETFNEALKLYPRQSEPYHHLRHIYIEEKNWRKAYEIQKEINRMSDGPDNRLLAYLKTEEGKTLFAENKKQEARKAFKEALKRDPASPEALMNLGRYFYEEGKVEKAIKLWKEMALSHFHGGHLVIPLLDEALFNEGRYDDVGEILREIITKFPENVIARRHLGNYYLKKGMIKEAQGVFRELQEKFPRYKPGRIDYMRFLLKEGDQSAIIEEVRVMVEAEETEGEDFYCSRCGLTDGRFRWRCPRCQRWDSYQLKLA